MKVTDFGDNFIWGASISAAQTESAILLDGKAASIWDEFCNNRGRLFNRKNQIKNNHHIDQSADFYFHYQQDIDLLKSMGFKHFRFSISWSRVLPDGETVNEAGIDFYQRVIAYCHASGIEPWVTLYHWDLPAALEKKGGWTNRQILDWFELYARLCVQSFPTVQYWMVLNEPSVFVGAGYFFGIHAPGKKGFTNFFKAMHHATLSIGHIYRIIKALNPTAKVGSTFSFTQIESVDDSPKNVKAAYLADLLINRMFFEPLIGLGYPIAEFKKLKRIRDFFKEGDEALLAVPLDFIGIQNYTREVFRHNPFNPFLKIKQIPPEGRTKDLTAMKWEIHPPGIYNILHKINAYNTGIPLIITENGIALDDQMKDGKVQDEKRVQFFTAYLEQVAKAKNEGVDIQGYFAWSLMDNFEWAEGYHPRFGLVYIDFESKRRVLKDSALWFRNFLGQ
ncbi:MAG: GH1 family beta-glucosidase [Bacteroidota bacterium]